MKFTDKTILYMGKFPAPPRKSAEFRCLHTPHRSFSKLFSKLGHLVKLEPWVWKSNVSFLSDSPPVPREGAVELDGKPTGQNSGNLAFLPVVANQEFNLGFSLQKCWLPQASTQPEADGLHIELTNQTFSTKVFQKQGLAKLMGISLSSL